MAKTGTNSSAKATIFDVAELAGVSIKTVSRVVNNEPNVRDKTRDKVLSAVAKLSYKPNVAARGLSGKRSFVIGLVYENPHEFSYMGSVLNGAFAACEQEGYSLLLRPLTLSDQAIGESVRQFALQARVDGVVLPAPLGDIEAITDVLEEMQIPYAAIAPKFSSPKAINITCDEESASFSLVEHVIDQGHRVVGFIKGHPDHSASEKRLAGYRKALKEHKIGYSAKLVKQGYFDFDSGKKAAEKLLKLRPRPTVIVASNDDMAAGVMFEAKEMGLSIPEDLSVVGFDDTPLASHLWPTLTTVRQPITQMADTATRSLIKSLRGEECPAPETFHCELVIRNSSEPL